jgi:hypothetical protein
MISQEEWDNLKEKERYGMIVDLFKRVQKLEQRCDEHMQIGDVCPHNLQS